MLYILEVKTILAILISEKYFCESIVVPQSTFINEPKLKFVFTPTLFTTFNKVINKDPSKVVSFNGDVYIDKVFYVKTSFVKAMFFIFMSFYAFDFQYDNACFNTLVCIEKLIFNWKITNTNTSNEKLNSLLKHLL